ncbi:capsular polysaccharide export protein, LipB/KpsS family [Rubrimonas sp.]|uniref:capsular polysaccharide export protein, LipB/KpsS family n=1 Tax=Rubrimonas sp. TaxID=2036015 RepID=UPI002FDCD1DE
MSLPQRFDAPAEGAPVLPPALRGWPSVLRAGGQASRVGPAEVSAALTRICAEALFWPATRARAARPRALALGPSWRVVALAGFPEADVAVDEDLAGVALDRLETVFGPPDAPAMLWAELGGLAGCDTACGGSGGARGGPEPGDIVASARGVSPWNGAALTLSDAVEAQAALRRAAAVAKGPVTLVGMSRWKRRCLRPFLTGPDGPPRAGRIEDAPGPAVVWGGAPAPARTPAGAPVLRVEDGFLRSVGLGLRHVPPLSLTIDAGAPYFDATGPNAFEAVVGAADFAPALLARAARLRAAVASAGVTKYNLTGDEPLPDPGGRLAVLVPGQVAGDASIRLGARAVRDDAGLLRAARSRFPDGFLLYKPHPDTLAGLRRGAAETADALAPADAVVRRANPAACLAWADRVATITSLMGFEALLRGKVVTTFGRPFYAGWGLTDDADPPPRLRQLDLDELVAAALILYPRYIDPDAGLPATPEAALAALLRRRAAADRPAARLARLWRDGLSWTLNRLVP